METLEEAAERNHNEQKLNTYTPYGFNDAFKDGAKWQQERSYSEEEVHSIVSSYSIHLPLFKIDFTYGKWFEQFKKK